MLNFFDILLYIIFFNNKCSKSYPYIPNIPSVVFLLIIIPRCSIGITVP